MDNIKPMTAEECKAFLDDCNFDGGTCFGHYEEKGTRDTEVCLATLAAEQHRRTMEGVVAWLRGAGLAEEQSDVEYIKELGRAAKGFADTIEDIVRREKQDSVG